MAREGDPYDMGSTRSTLWTSRTISRRTFLKGSAVAAGGLAVLGSGGLLAACTGSASPSPQGFGALNYRLSWLENAQFAGVYLADTNGYYKSAGFSSVNLLPGGPSATPIESDVSSGRAFVAPSQPDLTAQALNKGASLKIVACLYQKNPFCVLSLEKSPVANPQAMIGKKIGLGASNMVIWNAFLAANNIPQTSVTTVTEGFDLSPLLSGQVDMWLGWRNDEYVSLVEAGHTPTVFLLADYGYVLSSQTYIVTDQTLKTQRAKVKAFLKAEIQGWTDAFADPAKGAALAVDKYGKTLGLKLSEQTLQVENTKPLAITADTQKNGIMTMTPDLIAGNIDTLNRSNIKATASQLFDMSLINEVYSENPSLK